MQSLFVAVALPERALIVDPQPDEIAVATVVLKELGCEPSVVSTFEEAKRRLTSTADLSFMITAVRLREFNGVHLALRARALFPGACIVVTDHAFDPIMAREAVGVGAVYAVKPLDADRVASLLGRLRPQPTATRGEGSSAAVPAAEATRKSWYRSWH